MPLLSTTYRRTRLRKVGSIAHIIGNASRMYHESSFWYQSENRDNHQYPNGHQACNKSYRGVLQIKKTADKGLGLFADRDFAIGDLVMKSKPVATSNKRYSHSIQIDWNRHITSKFEVDRFSGPPFTIHFFTIVHHSFCISIVFKWIFRPF